MNTRFLLFPQTSAKPLNSILLVLVGFCLSTSSIATGIRVGYSVSFGSALWICIAGNLVLFLCALFWGMLGCRTGYTSQHLLGAMLGRKVSLLFSGFVILAMTIWLGMNGEWLANIVFHLFSQWRIPVPVTTLLIIAVGTCCSTFGWKTLEITSKIMVPIILVVGYVILHVNSMGIGLDAIAQYQPRGHLSASESFVLVVGNFAMSRHHDPGPVPVCQKQEGGAWLRLDILFDAHRLQSLRDFDCADPSAPTA